MTYIINMVLILFWNGIISDDVKEKKKWLCVLYCLQWILLSGLRDYSVGADTYAYKIYHFDKVLNMSWRQIWNRFGAYLRGAEGIKDPGYQLFEKICQIFVGDNYTLYLLIIAAIFTIAMTFWIYKYSDNVCMSFMVYSALFYAFFAITGHRQTIASALVIFGGYECMKKNKLIPLLCLHFIAFFIHKSSICFLILYFARYIKINKLYWILATVAIICSFLFRNQLMSFLGNFMGYEDYVEQFEGAGAYTFTAILLVLYVIVLLFYEKLPNDVDTRYSVVAFTLALFFSSLTFVDPSAMRVVQYFSVFIMLLIPRIINLFDNSSRFLANSICYVVLLFYMVLSMPEYTFIFI